MADLALTAEQRAVVTAPDGPLLALAGPGTGKTAVLAARIAYLIAARGLGPASVLALTFSKRAALELRRRLVLLLGDEGRAVDVATFHGFGLRLLRQWQTALGYAPHPLTVIGSREAAALLAETVEALGLADGGLPTGALWRAVERYRMAVDGAADVEVVRAIVTAYEARLRQRGAADYPAMLLDPWRLLRDHPEVARLYHVAYRAIVLDEAQDACAVQYALVRQLAAQHRHLVLVGDPAQSLFAWRGADGRILGCFLRDFPEARVFTLSQNFRSTPQIVAVANGVGHGLPLCLPLRTANAPGPPPIVHLAIDEQAEGRYIAEEVARLLAGGEIRDPGEAAVLFRTNAQADPIAAALRSRGFTCGVVAAETARESDGGVDRRADEASRTGDQVAAFAPGRVPLLTIHAAKGLQWPVVFVTGWEEGLLPHAHALQGDDTAALAEERRVAYVAVSRPQRRLYLTACRARLQGGRAISALPSRFLSDLDGVPLARTA